MRCFVIMGVSGCGKTTVGQAVAQRIEIAFIDGDALHAPQSIQKMSEGIALSDDDRMPWLAQVGRKLKDTNGPVIIGCSALKRKYRDLIRKHAAEPVAFIHLNAPKAVLAKRVAQRENHFMPASLLDSQYGALERLQIDETGTEIDISRNLEDVLRKTQTYVERTL